MCTFLLPIIICLTGISGYAQSTSDNSDYYNQPLPSGIPEVFAPGLISKAGSYEYPCSFSNDMTEMYFGVNLYNEANNERYILCVKKKSNGEWTHPERLSFTGYPESEPILSPDNSLLFFNVHTDTSKWKPHDIWYVKRHQDDWGQPTKLNSNINSDEYEFYTTMTKNNKIYFTREGRGIYTADLKNNDFYNVTPVDTIINKMNWASHPYISPDENYLIFDSSEPGGYGSADLYISFKSDQRWGEPINLGARINSSQWDVMPIVSPDGRFLFFCRQSDKDRDVYWVKFDLEKYKRFEHQ